MWTAKVKFSEEKTLIGSRCQKYGINLFAFPLSYTYEKSGVIVNITGTILGKKENITEFVEDLRKQKRILKLEVNGDFFIGTIREPMFAKVLYNKDIFHLAPALVSDKGYELVNIGCFEKKQLAKAIEGVEKNLEGEVLSLKEKEIKSISITKMHPELTDKQKHAMEFAIKNGYYEVPRKTSVEKLAKLSRLSFSTFQVHLRKAEQKLIPFFFN